MVLAVVCITSHREATSHSTWSLMNVSAEQHRHLSCLSTQGIPFSSSKVNICTSPALGKECLLVLLFMHWLPWYFYMYVYSITWLQFKAFFKMLFLFKPIQSTLVNATFSQLTLARCLLSSGIRHPILVVPSWGENRQLESKCNHWAAACPLLLTEAVPEISSLTLAKVDKYTAVKISIHQCAERTGFCMLSTQQTTCSPSTALWGHRRILNSAVLPEEKVSQMNGSEN